MLYTLSSHHNGGNTMSKIKSYAAPQAGAELELYEYDAGELKAEDVEVQVDYCGICHSDLSMIDNEWGFSNRMLDTACAMMAAK